jgi:hypothetical protein
MWRTREISAIVYGALQIANTVTSALTPPFLKFSLVSYVGLLDIACWLAFVVFAAAAFKQFSLKWLRVMAALLIYYYLPAGLLLWPYKKSVHFIPLDWLLSSASIVVAAGQLFRLAIAGSIYIWSVRRERASIAKPDTDAAT